VRPEAVKELAQVGFDPLYGARPLRRALQDRVENAIASYLLDNQLRRGDTLVLEAGGKISVQPGARELR
jgi:ATP-dependent Clp protease ATP-binding subunit ClpB